MKKILLLGGSTQQIPAIEYANKKGYFTILCDYLTDNPGQKYAKKYYNVSTTDKEAVLEIAQKENIDGIVAYASDPAAPTAAYIAEKLNLPTNPYNSVKTLSYKDKFRKFLQVNNFNYPKSETFINFSEASTAVKSFSFPIMVKPVDSSGSKGVRKVESIESFELAYKEALKAARNDKIIVEEFIEKDHPYMIGGDCFVINGKVELWGLLNCYRNPRVNELVPIGKSHPLIMSKERITKVKQEVQHLMNVLGINFGGFNLEIMVDSKDRVFFIEVGPRNGGNLIPELIEKALDGDMIAATIECAMGINYKFKLNTDQQRYLSTYQIHTEKNGELTDIIYKNNIKEKISNVVLFKEKGEKVQYLNSSNMAIGIIFLEFDNQDEQLHFMGNHENYIEVVVG